MKPPSAHARLILDRYKASESLGSVDKQRLLDVIQQRGARGDLPRFDVEPAQPVAPNPSWPARMWAAPLGKLAVVSALVGVPALVAFGARNGSGPPDARPAAAISARPDEANGVSAQSARPEEPKESQRPPLLGTPPPTNAPRARARPERSTDTSAPTPSSSEPTIDEEVRLLNAAQSSLRSGNPAEALRLLNEHASRFPSSKLADARAVAHMTTLCKLGQSSQARQEADRFLAAHPGSPFADRVRKICLPQAEP